MIAMLAALVILVMAIAGNMVDAPVGLIAGGIIVAVLVIDAIMTRRMHQRREAEKLRINMLYGRRMMAHRNDVITVNDDGTVNERVGE